MMNRNRLVLYFILTLIFSLFLKQETYAYGWGYKKNDTNTLPDIGRYAEILKPYQTFYADKAPLNKEIYLTFDNGYEAGYTAKTLDILKKHQVPATFFVTGHYVKSEEALIKRMDKEGHIIGNHSDKHKDFTKLSKSEMEKELLDLEKAVGKLTSQKELMYMRPPKGNFNENTLKWTDEFGYHHVFWSLAFKDWETDKQKGWRYAYDEIMQQMHPGAIILLHTVSADNVAALEKVILQAKKAGYTFRSLDDLYVKQNLGPFILM